jgi:hypothetical protein
MVTSLCSCCGHKCNKAVKNKDKGSDRRQQYNLPDSFLQLQSSAPHKHSSCEARWPVALSAVVVCVGLEPLARQSPLLDKRIPYYVLPGCDYMLKAGDKCNTTSFAPAVGCCPVGFQCVLGSDKVTLSSVSW